MDNLASSSLCLLIIVLFFSSGCNNVKAEDNLAASPPREEPCYAWLGVCSGVGSDAEKNQLCKKRCTAYFHKENDGRCVKLGGVTPLCFCPEDCNSPDAAVTLY